MKKISLSDYKFIDNDSDILLKQNNTTLIKVMNVKCKILITDYRGYIQPITILYYDSKQ